MFRVNIIDLNIDIFCASDNIHVQNININIIFSLNVLQYYTSTIRSWAQYRPFELKIDFLLSRNHRTRITCVKIVCAYVQMFDNFSMNCCGFELAIACMRGHSIIECTHISLISLKIQKMNFRTNQGISEGPETLAQEYSMRQIQICRVYVCSGVT